MKASRTRREFLRQSLSGAIGLMLPRDFARAEGAPLRERLNIAVIGLGTQGTKDLWGCAEENIVALCDPDDTRTLALASRLKGAKSYRDYREMFAKQANIDAVVISTPDHHHACATLMALKKGIHVFCQKPLTHTVREARVVRDAAARSGSVTQMGNQGHAMESTRRLVELIRAGIIGNIREAHLWSDRPLWTQGPKPVLIPSDLPRGLDWNLWIGPAPNRSYSPGYAPFRWRGWCDFGTGAYGDMGCHLMDAVFWALNLEAPKSIEPLASEPCTEMYPGWSIIRSEFAANKVRPACTVFWYDGGKVPPGELLENLRPSRNGALLVGSEGKVLYSNWNPNGFVVKNSGNKAVANIPITPIPRAAHGVYREWLDACKGKGRCLGSFDFASKLSESILLGNVALRCAEKIEWDAGAGRITNSVVANRFLDKNYRAGWELPFSE